VTARPIVAGALALGLAVGSVLAWRDDRPGEAAPTVSASSSPSALAVATPLDGATAFAAKGCAWCHDSPRGPAVIGGGPP
jgi:hypothetical protein